MAFQPVERVEGQRVQSSVPAVSILSTGQVRFSRALSKEVNGGKVVTLYHDPETKKLGIRVTQAPITVKGKTLSHFKLSWTKTLDVAYFHARPTLNAIGVPMDRYYAVTKEGDMWVANIANGRDIVRRPRQVQVPPAPEADLDLEE